MANTVDSANRLEPGTRVTILDGIFAGFEGEVREPWHGESLVRMRLMIFGRPTPVDLEPWQVCPPRWLTESEWQACTDVTRVLGHVRPQMSPRKLRLFACACCRHLWSLLTKHRGRPTVLLAEQYADGLAGEKELDRATDPFRRRGWARHEDSPDTAAAALLDPDAWRAAQRAAFQAQSAAGFVASPNSDELRREMMARERRQQVDLLRDLVGNPFRSVTIALSWRTSASLALARAIYEERNFEEMPFLADALEEAGCTDETILSHCRGPGLHARGCWILDGLLGKE
jgi:hypothetical protein